MSYLPGMKYGMPHVKDGCGVFGILSKDCSKPVPSDLAVLGMNTARHRGSSFGAGYASMNLGDGERDVFRLRAFVLDREVAGEVAEAVAEDIAEVLGTRYTDFGGSPIAGMPVLEIEVRPPDRAGVSIQVDRINGLLLSDSGIRGRIYSYGSCMDVYKGVGYPDDVASLYGLQEGSHAGIAWVAHSRQPTNSPGALPIWSHPFASMDCAIVHNGDISSFGANMAFLESRGYHSHVGTDSEIIARLVEILVWDEGLSLEDALLVLSNPYSRKLPPSARELISAYRNARLDGPFSIVGTLGTGDDCYLFAAADRSKFRPLLLGEDEHYFFAASEESQIRAISPGADVWRAEAGSVFSCSARRGLISRGGRGMLRRPALLSVSGHAGGGCTVEPPPGYGPVPAGAEGGRFIGVGMSFRDSPATGKIVVSGSAGNCLANLNDGGVFEVTGNVADDLADTMSDGIVAVHGSAGDVAAQAMQGGRLFVRGSVGNRAAIQMREFGSRRPYMVICETAGDYLGEYMAGGRVVVLNLSNSPLPTGSYLGTGMVGGTIYVRGELRPAQLGLLPRSEDVMTYLESACDEGLIDPLALKSVDPFDVDGMRPLLPGWLYERVVRLFYTSKHSNTPSMERRPLSPDEKEELRPVLEECFASLSLDLSALPDILESDYCVVSVK